MEWMVKGKVNCLGDAKLRTFDDCGYSRAFKCGPVFCALELRNHFHIHFFVLHLCDARQPAYCWCGIYGAFRINTLSSLCLTSAQLFQNRP